MSNETLSAWKETSLPPSLEKLALVLSVSDASVEELRRDLFVGAVVVLILEKGFILCPVDGNYEIDEFSRLLKLPEHWKKCDGSYYEFQFALKQFPAHSVRMVITPLGDTVLVNAILFNINNDLYTKCIPLSPYVISPQAISVAEKYHNLTQLALDLNTNILSPVSSRILRHHGYESASLIGLSREVLFEIFKHLKVEDIINISQTCFDMSWIRSDNILWKVLLQRDYPGVLISQSSNHLNMYKEEYKKAKDTKLKGSSRSLLQRYSDMDNYLDMDRYSDLNYSWRDINYGSIFMNF